MTHFFTYYGNITGYTPRYFYTDIGDAHIYDNHKCAIEDN